MIHPSSENWLLSFKKRKMDNSFFINLWRFWIIRTLRSWDFELALFLTISLLVLKKCQGLEIEINYGMVGDVLIGFFSFVFAALAIFSTLTSDWYLSYLRKNGLFSNLLFQYWIACVVYLISMLGVFWLTTFKPNADSYWHGLWMFLFLYSLFLTIELVKTTISIGIYRDKYLLSIEKNTHK